MTIVQTCNGMIRSASSLKASQIHPDLSFSMPGYQHIWNNQEYNSKLSYVSFYQLKKGQDFSITEKFSFRFCETF